MNDEVPIISSSVFDTGFGRQCAVGRLVKHHGKDGGLLLVADSVMDEALETVEVLFVWIDGLPVPFWMDDFRFVGDKSAVVQFQEIPRREAAEALVGCTVSCRRDDAGASSVSPAGMDMLAGFSVRDGDGEFVGTVQEVFDFNGNFVLAVDTGRGTVQLPVHPDLTIRLDEAGRELQLSVPEGLL